MEDGRKERDAGMAAVMRGDPDYKVLYRSAMNALPAGFEGIGEDFHNKMQEMGLREPFSPNSKGANFNAAVRRGLVVDTDRREQMQNPRSHARSNNIVYRLVAPWE